VSEVGGQSNGLWVVMEGGNGGFGIARRLDGRMIPSVEAYLGFAASR